MHFGSRKKFCMSTTTKAVVSGAMLTHVSLAPSLVAMITFFVDPPERS